MNEEQIREFVDTSVEKAIDIRFSLKEYSPKYSDPLKKREASLLGYRAAIDSIDEVLVNLLKVRQATRARASSEKFNYESEFDRQLDKIRKTGSRLEYTGAKERISEADLKAFDAKKKANDASKLADYVNDATDIVRKLHRDLDSTRLDLHTTIKSFVFEYNLDR